MNDFEAIDQLLAAAAEPVPLPPAEQPWALRAALGLARAELARALGVSPSTVAGWGSGRDPSGETREKYAYFLKGADAKISTRDTTAPDTTASEPAPTASEPALTASEPAPADPHHEEQVDGSAFSSGGGRVSQRSRSIVKRLVPGAIVSAWTEPRARSNSPVPPVIPLSNEGGGPGLRMPKTVPCTESWPPGRL